MATLPSGSREEVELVQIETDELSLILKGKPYHERYESLKQYRSMDLHDTMTFVVKEETIQTTKVYDLKQNELVEETVLQPIFSENCVSQLSVATDQATELTLYHAPPSSPKAIPSNIL